MHNKKNASEVLAAITSFQLHHVQGVLNVKIFSVHFVVKESSLLLNLGLLMILMHNSAVSCALSLLPEQGIYKKC